MKRDKSSALFDAAQKLMPGGVNSPVRAFKAVGGHPIFIDRASGCLMYDADGNEYIDYVLSWGPMIAGHTHPAVTEALKEAVSRGTSFGAPTALEIELTRMVRDAFPSMELVRLVNSGTEATMSAIRLARAHTGRDKILKFEGCYHGHADSLLVKAGSGVATLGVPDSPGVPADFAKNTLTAPFNNFEAVKMIMENNGSDIACIIVEPVPGNMGVVPSADGFLRMLREITRQSGTVYQAGTLSGNPLAMTAGIETLKILSQPGTYERLNRLSEQLSQGFSDAAKSAGATVYNTGVGSMVCTFFTEGPVTDYESAKKSDTVAFGRFFLAMLEEGIYLAPSQFEAIFLSIAHKEEHIEKTIRAANKAFRKAGR